MGLGRDIILKSDDWGELVINIDELGEQLAKQAGDIESWKAEHKRVTSHFLAMDIELTKQAEQIKEYRTALDNSGKNLRSCYDYIKSRVRKNNRGDSDMAFCAFTYSQDVLEVLNKYKGKE